MWSRILPSSSGSKMHGKSSPQSPKSAEIQFKSYRIDNSADPPQVTLDSLPPLSMQENSLSNTSQIPSTNAPNNTPTNNLANGDPKEAMAPTSVPQVRTPSRIVSNPRHTFSSPLSVPPTDATSSPTSPSGDSGDSPAWSGAVGRASLGKSGRMIERLMADIDKLKRELNAEISHRQELSKREEVNKSTEDALRTENSNLQQAKEVDAALLRRRDRMIEDLKAELSGEKDRRQKAESRAITETKRREASEMECKKEVTEAKEIAKHATGHAEVLMQSHKQLRDEYKQRASRFSGDLQKVHTDREDDRHRVQKLNTIVQSLEHEIKRRDNAAENITEAFQTYQRDNEERFEKYVEKKEREVQKLKDQAQGYERLEREFEEMQNEVKWLIGLGRVANEKESSQGNPNKG